MVSIGPSASLGRRKGVDGCCTWPAFGRGGPGGGGGGGNWGGVLFVVAFEFTRGGR